jgi:hypothetical protein
MTTTWTVLDRVTESSGRWEWDYWAGEKQFFYHPNTASVIFLGTYDKPAAMVFDTNIGLNYKNVATNVPTDPLMQTSKSCIGPWGNFFTPFKYEMYETNYGTSGEMDCTTGWELADAYYVGIPGDNDIYQSVRVYATNPFNGSASMEMRSCTGDGIVDGHIIKGHETPEDYDYSYIGVEPYFWNESNILFLVNTGTVFGKTCDYEGDIYSCNQNRDYGKDKYEYDDGCTENYLGYLDWENHNVGVLSKSLMSASDFGLSLRNDGQYLYMENFGQIGTDNYYYTTFARYRYSREVDGNEVINDYITFKCSRTGSWSTDHTIDNGTDFTFPQQYADGYFWAVDGTELLRLEEGNSFADSNWESYHDYGLGEIISINHKSNDGNRGGIPIVTSAQDVRTGPDSGYHYIDVYYGDKLDGKCWLDTPNTDSDWGIEGFSARIMVERSKALSTPRGDFVVSQEKNMETDELRLTVYKREEKFAIPTAIKLSSDGTILYTTVESDAITSANTEPNPTRPVAATVPTDELISTASGIFYDWAIHLGTSGWYAPMVNQFRDIFLFGRYTNTNHLVNLVSGVLTGSIVESGYPSNLTGWNPTPLLAGEFNAAEYLTGMQIRAILSSGYSLTKYGAGPGGNLFNYEYPDSLNTLVTFSGFSPNTLYTSTGFTEVEDYMGNRETGGISIYKRTETEGLEEGAGIENIEVTDIDGV